MNTLNITPQVAATQAAAAQESLVIGGKARRYFPLIKGTKKPAISAWPVVGAGIYKPEKDFGIALDADDLVIDADPRNYPKNPDGTLRPVLKELLTVLKEHGVTPGYTVRTPRGGYHVYLTKPADKKIKKHQLAWPGIDFLSKGCYACGPGTHTVANEDDKTVEGDYVVFNSASAVAAPTAWLDSLEVQSEAATGPEVAASLSGAPQFKLECEAENGATEGSRGISAYKLACRGRDLALPKDVTYEHMRDCWAGRCSPPMDLGELYESVEHAYKYAKSKFGRKSAEAAFADVKPSPPQDPAERAKLTSKAGTAKTSQATKLAWCARDCELWHDSANNTYATIAVNGHKENYRIRSAEFKNWIKREFYTEFKGVPGASAVDDALGKLDGDALYSGAQHSAATRMATVDGCIYIDLGDEAWRAVKVSADGWEVVTESPVKFLRPRDMQPLSLPVSGGPEDLEDFRKLFNLRDDQSWALLKGFLVACFRPDVPAVVLAVTGEQGSGKTAVCQAIRKLVDPHTLPLRGAPRNEQDILVALKNGYLLGFDNLSTLSRETADVLCRITTGGGNGFRTHYENDQETVFCVMRPIILNAIGDVVARFEDLQSRTISLHVQALEGHQRLTHKELWSRFDEMTPRLLGALLSAVSAGLKNLPYVQLPELPRSADFVQFAVAAEASLGLEPGEFMRSFSANKAASATTTIEASALGQLILKLEPKWEGTASDLLGLLRLSNVHDVRALPATSKTLSDNLLRLEPVLRELGVTVKRDPRTSHKRNIRIERRECQEYQGAEINGMTNVTQVTQL